MLFSGLLPCLGHSCGLLSTLHLSLIAVTLSPTNAITQSVRILEEQATEISLGRKGAWWSTGSPERLETQGWGSCSQQRHPQTTQRSGATETPSIPSLLWLRWCLAILDSGNQTEATLSKTEPRGAHLIKKKIFFFYFIWSMANEQCHDSFRWTAKGLSHTYTCTHSPVASRLPHDAEQSPLCMYAKLVQSCPSLCNPMDCSPPDSSV